MTTSTKKIVEGGRDKNTEAVLATIIARVNEALQGTSVSAPSQDAYHLHGSEDQEGQVLTVDFMLDHVTTLPLNLGGWALFEANAGDAANRLSKRMVEAQARKDKLLALLSAARDRVAAAVEKAGGEVRLHGVCFAPVSAEYAINMRDVPLEISHSELGSQLVSVRQTDNWTTPHEFAKHLRFIGPRQRQLAAQRHRLRENDALFEISAFTEAAITAAGHNLGHVLRRVAEGETNIELGGKWTKQSDSRLSLTFAEGWLHLVGYVLPSPGGAFFAAGAMRFDQPIDEARRRSLIGQPAHTLFDHPVTRVAGRIAKVIDRDGRSNEVTFKGVQSRLIRKADIGRES